MDRWLLPSTYMRMASIRFSEEYPCGKGSGVYTRLHAPHRYRWLPDGLNPALYCFWLAWHFGHFMLLFYSVSDFGHSQSDVPIPYVYNTRNLVRIWNQL